MCDDFSTIISMGIAMDVYAYQVADWLERRVTQAEKNDPELVVLKQNITEATARLAEVSEAGLDIAEAARLQNAAIVALLTHQGLCGLSKG